MKFNEFVKNSMDVLNSNSYGKLLIPKYTIFTPEWAMQFPSLSTGTTNFSSFLPFT